MPDTRHKFRLKGAAAEETLRQLAIQSFFTDWCYPNPKLPNAKELCDLLVVFDQMAIIWQIKDLKLREDGTYNPREVAKNTRQLAGARRQMFDLARPIRLQNPRRGPEPFDATQIREVYLVSVLAGEEVAFLPAADAIHDRAVHVFTRSFLGIVLKELDTVADFIRYLRAKESLLAAVEHLTILGGEEELLAYYLTHDRSFGEMATATALLLEEGGWIVLLKSPEYAAKRRADRISYGWDAMIDRVHERGSLQYERVARELARLNRFERRSLSRVFYEAHAQAHEDDAYDMLRRVIPMQDRTYCFLFADDPEPRDHRKALLQALCYVARGTFKANATVIGIATEKKLKPECTYDYLLLEMPKWSEADEQHTSRIREATGLLSNVTMGSTHEDEWP
jgi:hypothetical protein